MNKQKGLVPLLIVLLIALAAGGYLIYTNFRQKIVNVYYSNNQTKVNLPQQTIQPSVAPQYSVSVDQQANLKTYSNKKAGFSIQYSVNYQDSMGDDSLTLDDKKISKTDDGCGDRPNFRIGLYIEQTKETSAKEIAQKRKDDDKTWAGEIIKQSEMLIDGVPASVTEWRLGKCQDGVSIDIVRNGYRIEVNKYPPKGQESEFNQILSTFRFDSLP